MRRGEAGQGGTRVETRRGEERRKRTRMDDEGRGETRRDEKGLEGARRGEGGGERGLRGCSISDDEHKIFRLVLLLAHHSPLYVLTRITISGALFLVFMNLLVHKHLIIDSCSYSNKLHTYRQLYITYAYYRCF